MRSDQRQTESIIAIRANLLELIAVAVGIALGVNLLAGAILESLRAHEWASIIIGALLVIAGCGYLIWRAVPRINRQYLLQGVVPIDAQTHELIPIGRYEFAEETARNFRALTAENKALQRLWSESSLNPIDVDKDGHVTRVNSHGAKLIREALEYFVLNELSLHLEQHLENNPRVDDAEIVTIGRRDIPSVLLENRFLELFSKPMEERESFRAHPTSIPEHKVVYSIAKDGAIFDDFELVLPRGAQVARLNPDSVALHTPRFSMEIEALFDGSATTLPRQFEELYLGREFSEIRSYQVNLELRVKFKLWSLFTATGWEYYRWLDSFLDRLQEAFSFERFLDDIGWSTAVTARSIIPQLPHLASRGAATDNSPLNLTHDKGSGPRSIGPKRGSGRKKATGH